MNLENTYNYLLPFIDSITKEYNYLNLDNNRIKNLVIKEIENSREINRDDISYSDYIKQEIIKKLNMIVKDTLNNESTNFNLISNYINYNFKKTNDYKLASAYLIKLNNFFAKYNFIPSIDLIINLLKQNELINNLVLVIVSKNISLIKSGKIDKKYSNNELLFIEAYCLINKIDVVKYIDDNIIYNLNDSVDMYLKEIGKYPILTSKEEQELSLKIKNGDKLALEKFIKCNLKLVVSFARKYMNQGLDILDLIEEGNIALMTAVSKFDGTMGYKFSTYAFYYIKSAMENALRTQGRNIKINEKVSTKISLYKKIRNDLEIKFQREVTYEEIANEMNISVDKVIKLENLQFDTYSLNNYVNEDHDVDMGYFALKSDEKTPEEVSLDKSLSSILFKLIDSSKLTNKQLNILLLRFGFINNRIYTLEEIGKMYNNSRESIRTTIERTLKKLRKSSLLLELLEYRDNPDKSLENIAMDISKKEYLTNSIFYKEVKYNSIDIEITRCKILDMFNQNDVYDIGSDNFLKLENLLKKPIFIKMMERFNYEEMIVFLFRMNYIKIGDSSLKTMSRFLHTNESKVVEMGRKTLEFYKKNIKLFLNDDNNFKKLIK